MTDISFEVLSVVSMTSQSDGQPAGVLVKLKCRGAKVDLVMSAMLAETLGRALDDAGDHAMRLSGERRY